MEAVICLMVLEGQWLPASLNVREPDPVCRRTVFTRQVHLMSSFKFEAWPTEFRTVTQYFGVNPQNYSQFGLPGHDCPHANLEGSTDAVPKLSI